MKYRRFGRTNWQVSEIGYGMWGLADWQGTDSGEVDRALKLSIDLGCNFFDTAFAYGWGASEKILGNLIRTSGQKKLFVASKIPPKNRKWPANKGSIIEEVFPNDYILESVETSLKNLGLEQIDLMQFHVWNDEWHSLDGWKKTIQEITKAGKVAHWGISVNRWQPENCLLTLQTGLISGVQVVYNILDQMPEDELFPLCEKLDIGIIARVPFDEGTLTGKLTQNTTFEEGDYRRIYFKGDNLKRCIEKAEHLSQYLPEGMSLPEMALRFILANPLVGTTIPGMRQEKHVQMNINSSDGKELNPELMKALKSERWYRTFAEWS
jgi:aryl-alcohol dehydrogenase-like predicted oxidoreductase